jgi:radical SAM protein with 4Fe4S-binding SPASM domain
MERLIELCVEITDRCVLNCIHCSTGASENPDKNKGLNYDEICSVILDFCLCGGSILEISGGEPTLHSSLFEIVDFAKSKNLEVRLYTAGVAWDNKPGPLKEGFLKGLLTLGLDKIIFNLQGPKEIHDFITQKAGSFEAVYESIKRAKKLGFWVGIHFVPMKPNAMKIGEVLEVAKNLSIDEVALLRFVPQGRGKANETELKLTREELWGFLEYVVNLKKVFQEKPQIRTGCPLDFLGFIDQTSELCNCKAAISSCSITPAGDVIPCPGFKQLHEFIAGNIREKSLEEIWTTAQVFDDIRKIDYRNLEICSKCSMLDTCKGRCLAQRARQYGNLLKGPDPDCNLYKRNKIGKRKSGGYYSGRGIKSSGSPSIG